MKNFVKPGKVMTVVAGGAIVSGQMYQVGTLVGVATGSAASGEEYELALMGVYKFTKDSALDLAQGVAVDWDDTAKEIVATTTGDFGAGAVAKAAGVGETEVEVLLPLGGY